MVLRLLVTRDRLPNTLEFLTHAQYEMSRRLAESSFLFATYLGRSKRDSAHRVLAVAQLRLRYTHGTYLTEPNETNANLTPTTIVTIPYIKGTSEIVARILQPYNIRVAHRPITNLRKLLTNVKDKDRPKGRQGKVYKIKCFDCQATYIGETGRNLNTDERRGTVTSTILT